MLPKEKRSDRAWLVRGLTLAMTMAWALLTGCGGGSDSVDTGPPPQITMILSSSSATTLPGETVSFDVTVTGSSGFSGPATIAVTGAPSGVTASASTPQVSGSTTTSTVNITVGTAVSAGTHTLTVTASGGGVESITRSFALTISALPGGFRIAATASTLTLAQGSTATTTITITRTGGFAGAVGLSATGMSNGLTATLLPASATGSAATLSLTANSVATPGTFSLTIVGNAASLPAQMITTQVTVTPGPNGGAGSVTVDFSGCGAETKPVWFAFQDGGGPWSRVTPANDIYRFTISGNAGGYAIATRDATNATSVAVRMLSSAELTAAPINVCPVPRGTKSITATVQGVGQNQQATLNLGGSAVLVPASGTVTIPDIPNGTFDLVAWRMNSARGLNTPSDSKGIIIRDVNIPDGSSAGSFNFADVGNPSAWIVNFTGTIPGDTFTGSMQYYTGPRESCTGALLYNFSNNVPTIPGSAWGFPADIQRATDYYVMSAVATNGGATRISRRSSHLAGIAALHFGGTVLLPAISDVSGASYKRLQAVGATPAEYSSTIDFRYTNTAGDRTAALEASVAWLGGNTGTLTFPDFTSVSGWDNNWVPAPSSNVLWTFGGTGASHNGLPCVEGATFRAGYVSGEK